MPAKANRINVYLNDADYARVQHRATQAGMTIPAYLRRIACGVVPVPKTQDFVTHCVADVADDLDAAAEDAREKSSKSAILTARDRLRELLRQHINANRVNTGA